MEYCWTVIMPFWLSTDNTASCLPHIQWQWLHLNYFDGMIIGMFIRHDNFEVKLTTITQIPFPYPRVGSHALLTSKLRVAVNCFNALAVKMWKLGRLARGPSYQLPAGHHKRAGDWRSRSTAQKWMHMGLGMHAWVGRTIWFNQHTYDKHFSAHACKTPEIVCVRGQIITTTVVVNITTSLSTHIVVRPLSGG